MDRMVNNSIAYLRLVNDTMLWIKDLKPLIFSVFVFPIFQLPMQTKNMIFKISFKVLNIGG